MARVIPRVLGVFLLLGVVVRQASAVPIGLLTFDELTATGTTFNITNLTGGLFAPDFPVLTPLTISVTDLTAVTSDGTTLGIAGGNFSRVGETGDVNCTAPGDAGSGGCNVAGYEIVSATLRGTLSPLTGIAGLPEGFDSLVSTFSATLGPSCGDTLVAGCDFAIIEATPTTAPTPVPEPSGVWLLAAGLTALVARRLLDRKARSRALRAGLVAALLVAGRTPASAQTLAPSANPPSGGAGVNNSYLTGSGFPAGPITGAVAHFARTCAAPALASAPITQVATLGALRRFQFLIPASLAPGAYRVWVTGTAGTSRFDTLGTSSCSALTVTSSIVGTASLGAAIAGAAVTVVDSTGRSASAVTASDGTFAVSSAGLVPPFLVRVVTASATGSFPAGTTLYSVSADASASTRINVSVLTDLMVRSFYSAQGVDPAIAFANPTGSNAAPTPTAVQSLAGLVLPAVQLWFDGVGIAATPGAPGNGAINLISSPFVAFPPGSTPTGGLDAVLHLITSELVSPLRSAASLPRPCDRRKKRSKDWSCSSRRRRRVSRAA